MIRTNPNSRLDPGRSGPTSEGDSAARSVIVACRSPYDWRAMLGFLAARAIDGVEAIVDGTYCRTHAEGGRSGVVEIRHLAAPDRLEVTVRGLDRAALDALRPRVRRVFDVDADVQAIGRHLAGDDRLAPLVARRPGLRVPGGWDGFELAVRAVLGQQITVAAARGLAGRLVTLCGTRIEASAGLGRLFPTPAQMTGCDLASLGMPAARRATLRALAEAALADGLLFEPDGIPGAAVGRLRRIPGIGEWTAQYIALRALREPDAFPAGDIVLRRCLAAGPGERPTEAALLVRAASWRPWRGYAAQHLWTEAASRPDPA